MFIRVIHRDTCRRLLSAAAAVTAAGLMLRFPQALANGVSRGLSVCSSVIIPTLYPFMILAGLLTESPLCRKPGRVSAAISRWLFGLPGCCGPAILIGFVGGYPAGALAVGRLLEQGQITPEQARRMTRFCVNGGPGFIISTVGAGLMGSVRAGILLFAAHAATSLGIGIALGQGHRGVSEKAAKVALPPPRPIADTVKNSCTALLTMCGFVLLAAAALSVGEAIGIPVTLGRLTRLPAGLWSTAAATVLEVSCGCIALAGVGESAPFWLCVCMGWGGLSVQGQLAAALPGLRIPDAGFWCGRLLHGIISGCIAAVLFRLIPAGLPAVAALAPGDTAAPFSASPQAGIALLTTTFVVILCFCAKNAGKTEESVLHCKK